MRIRLGSGQRESWMFFMTIIYRGLLDLVYCLYASRTFEYLGLTYEFNVTKLLISWALLFICFPTMKKCFTRAKFSHAIMLFLLFLAYIPYTTLTAFFGYQYSFIAANSVYWILFFFLFDHFPVTRGSLSVSVNSDWALLVIESIFAGTIVFISWRYTGFRFTIGLSDAYSYRAEAKLAGMPTVLSYLFAASKAVNPIILVYFLSRKKYIKTGLVALIQILSFSVNGSKTVLLSTLCAVAVFFIYDDSFLKKIPVLMGGLGLATYLEPAVLGTNYLLAYIVRRVLFVPNQLGAYYYDFFSVNPPDYYKQGFLRLFGAKSVYGMPIVNMIADSYFGKPDMASNSGLVSDAVANFGPVGVVIMPVVLVIVLRLLDKCAEGVEKRLYISMSVIIAFILISTFLPTVLLTHGLIALGLVLLIMPRKEEERESEILNTWALRKA